MGFVPMFPAVCSFLHPLPIHFFPAVRLTSATPATAMNMPLIAVAPSVSSNISHAIAAVTAGVR